MKYLEVPISENVLRESCSKSHNLDGGNPILFVMKKDGKKAEGIVRDINPTECVLLLLYKVDERIQHETVRYEDVAIWSVPSKIELAKEVSNLQIQLNTMREINRSK